MDRRCSWQKPGAFYYCLGPISYRYNLLIYLSNWLHDEE